MYTCKFSSLLVFRLLRYVSLIRRRRTWQNCEIPYYKYCTGFTRFCGFGPSHWKSGIPATPAGRVTEQVRVTDSPATMGEEGEEEREMVVGSVERW